MPTIVDHVRFFMPSRRELLFPAFGTVQAVTGQFADKMKQQDLAPHIPDKQYRLSYQLEMDAGELDFFRSLGLKLDPEPEAFDRPDMVIDLTESRLDQFPADDHKHVANVYSIIAGAPAAPFPALRRVKQSVQPRWARIGDLALPFPTLPVTGEELALCSDEQWYGVVGVQGWETYMAAVMGLAVIEILPADRHRNRLSKWFASHYRMVEAAAGDLDRQLWQAYFCFHPRVTMVPAPVYRQQATHVLQQL